MKIIVDEVVARDDKVGLRPGELSPKMRRWAPCRGIRTCAEEPWFWWPGDPVDLPSPRNTPISRKPLPIGRQKTSGRLWPTKSSVSFDPFWSRQFGSPIVH